MQYQFLKEACSLFHVRRVDEIYLFISREKEKKGKVHLFRIFQLFPTPRFRHGDEKDTDNVGNNVGKMNAILNRVVFNKNSLLTLK